MKSKEILRVGQVYEDGANYKNRTSGRVYSTNGIAQTLCSSSGGGHVPVIVEEELLEEFVRKCVPYYTREDKYDISDKKFCYPITSRDFACNGFKDICPTLAARDYKDPKCVVIKDGSVFRLRKLTPKEYGRLMGVSDNDIDDILSMNSDTQAYKQFGNSIVVDVLEEIFNSILL